MLPRELHDLVFKVYGNIIGVPASEVPGLAAWACVTDTTILTGEQATAIAWERARQDQEAATAARDQADYFQTQWEAADADRRVAEGQTDPAVVKVIWETPTFADYNFTAHPALEEMFGAGFIDKLQAALVGMHDPQLLSALPREAIIPASNDDFAGVASVARDLGMVR